MSFYHTQDYCIRCGSMYRLKPSYGSFTWACDCPPPRTYTSNNTKTVPLPQGTQQS